MENIITPAEIDAELISEAEERILDFAEEFRDLYALQKSHENFSENYDEAIYNSLDSAEIKNKAEQMLGNSFTVEQAVEAYMDVVNAVCSEASLFGNTVGFDCHVESDTVFVEFFVDNMGYDYRNKGDLEYQIVGCERDEPEKEKSYDYER